MRTIVVAMAFILIATAGCKKHDEAKVPAGYPGAPGPTITPDDLRMFEQATRQSPKNANAWTTYGNALMDTGRFNEAVEAYGKALQLDPKNADVRVDMGTCLRNSGRPQQAAEEYRKVIKIYPNHAYAHRNLGVTLAFDIHDRQAAIREFEKYLALSPNAADATEIRQRIEELKSGKL